MDSAHVVIVGAGHGGAQATIALRQAGYRDSILIIAAEPDLPYERPPLTKEYLLGTKPFERILIRPPAFWGEHGIDLWLGRRAVALDAKARAITLEDGTRIGFESLIWAAGAIPRTLSCAGSDLEGVHTLRTRRDVDQVRGELERAQRVVVIGGGYIGLETAAALSALGKHIALLEALERVLARVTGAQLSQFFEAEHRAHGVDVRTATRVDCILGDRGRVTGVQLVAGAIVPADLVIVGIGVVPAVGPLLAAGARGGDGVEVDSQCRTSLPGVYAIGDCARHANRFANGATVRLESVQNATDQAQVAARSIAGLPAAYEAVPWFWSNQYDLKLQTVGLSLGHDQTVVRGHVNERRFAVIYLSRGRVIALDCVNSPRDFVQGRRLVIERGTADPGRLADPTVPLR